MNLQVSIAQVCSKTVTKFVLLTSRSGRSSSAPSAAFEAYSAIVELISASASVLNVLTYDLVYIF